MFVLGFVHIRARANHHHYSSLTYNYIIRVLGCMFPTFKKKIQAVILKFEQQLCPHRWSCKSTESWPWLLKLPLCFKNSMVIQSSGAIQKGGQNHFDADTHLFTRDPLLAGEMTPRCLQGDCVTAVTLCVVSHWVGGHVRCLELKHLRHASRCASQSTGLLICFWGIWGVGIYVCLESVHSKEIITPGMAEVGFKLWVQTAIIIV